MEGLLIGSRWTVTILVMAIMMRRFIPLWFPGGVKFKHEEANMQFVP